MEPVRMLARACTLRRMRVHAHTCTHSPENRLERSAGRCDFLPAVGLSQHHTHTQPNVWDSTLSASRIPVCLALFYLGLCILLTNACKPGESAQHKLKESNAKFTRSS